MEKKTGGLQRLGQQTEELQTGGHQAEDLETGGHQAEDLQTGGQQAEDLQTGGQQAEDLESGGQQAGSPGHLKIVVLLIEVQKAGLRKKAGRYWIGIQNWNLRKVW